MPATCFWTRNIKIDPVWPRSVDQEVGTYKGDLIIKEPNTAEASLKIPEDIKEGETIHIFYHLSFDLT